jgi:hypothetical protein
VLLVGCVRRPRLYASAKLSAYDMCVLCHFCDAAGIQGGSFNVYSLPPDMQSGKYQRHLDSVLPDPSYLIEVPTPQHPNRRPIRRVVNVPVRMACESLADEIENDPTTMTVMRADPDSRDQCVLDTVAYRRWVKKRVV